MADCNLLTIKYIKCIKNDIAAVSARQLRRFAPLTYDVSHARVTVSSLHIQKYHAARLSH